MRFFFFNVLGYPYLDNAIQKAFSISRPDTLKPLLTRTSDDKIPLSF